MKQSFKCLILVLLFPFIAFSQVNVTGVVKSSKETLVGVTVWLKNPSTGKNQGASTDIDGKFTFANVAPGTYTLSSSYVGFKEYANAAFKVANEPVSVTIELEEDSKLLADVVVKTVAKKETATALINTLKSSFIVADGLSIESIKKTPDRNVSDALKRVSGVTIQNDKFVLVRGLADRYNSALLNKTQLPSTEPDRRAFSFDIIPTALIDNIIINKGAAANLPGDFAGGLVQITTKEVSGDFASASLGVSYGSLSTFKDFKLIESVEFPSTFPSTNAFRISGNGDKRAYTKLIATPGITESSSLPNFNGSVAFGVKRNNWNVLFSSTARNTFSSSTTERIDYLSSTDLAYKYKDINFSQTKSLSGLLNVVYLGQNRYSWKTLANYQTEDYFLNRTGENYDNVQNIYSNSSNAIRKMVVNTQFDAKIKTWDFNIGYNLMLRDQPDYRVNPTASYLNSGNPYLTAWRDTYRFWSVMDENAGNAAINKSLGDFKVGVGYLKKYRNFKARVFRYETIDMLGEVTNNTDRYTADFDLANGFVMYEKEMGLFKLNTGLRTEYNLFNIATADFSGQKVNVEREYLDLLPSLNLTYSATEKTKWRTSLSKTLARPEFREVANFAYYDFVRNAQLLGNKDLEKSDIYNIDFKWELYPKAGEIFSVGVFGKKFIKPIEQIVADGSVPSNLALTYTNPPSALVYGLEMEFRKAINSWLDLYSNMALIQSEVEVQGVKRQLQGQSNYALNGGLNFHKGNNTMNLTYNRVGDRIASVGFQGYPDIFENSRDVIDIVFLHKFSKGEIKLAVSDILAQPTTFYQKPSRDLIKTNNETSVSLTVNFNL
ncbi:outer membrane beta-barrel protein [Aquirufa antheringensis]|jgi:outer membrane receptor for ferrienterochelin and colicin|uniref:outer membrane beta-barrel protein n=1 Tax=Aquirufa antheringensis TaxID=2516559 RepID=UPI00208E20B8|nr:outer membrane beta-barrel protein [Aquirufa antheringensis]MCZ2490280.1 outer membrane beta-barrel protein [Aquirufa antheringensis]USQ03682.1 outer membrane beta-barrel protein [Aquirufa antheringensis]